MWGWPTVGVPSQTADSRPVPAPTGPIHDERTHQYPMLRSARLRLAQAVYELHQRLEHVGIHPLGLVVHNSGHIRRRKVKAPLAGMRTALTQAVAMCPTKCSGVTTRGRHVPFQPQQHRVLRRATPNRPGCRGRSNRCRSATGPRRSRHGPRPLRSWHLNRFPAAAMVLPRRTTLRAIGAMWAACWKQPAAHPPVQHRCMQYRASQEGAHFPSGGPQGFLLSIEKATVAPPVPPPAAAQQLVAHSTTWGEARQVVGDPVRTYLQCQGSHGFAANSPSAKESKVHRRDNEVEDTPFAQEPTNARAR